MLAIDPRTSDAFNDSRQSPASQRKYEARSPTFDRPWVGPEHPLMFHGAIAPASSSISTLRAGARRPEHRLTAAQYKEAHNTEGCASSLTSRRAQYGLPGSHRCDPENARSRKCNRAKC
ncbi:hypothetical protein EWB00_001994 [Schistosoma japonicum]|uniref:Uncharacterized protein n=1 Tax=Schistosoma japonicum TaxID=6182 RepID=A0A4Z2CKJ3_SCHJA|nr:hypothetical protein EWB00_001994 [Schistosoma japonicum]